MISFNTQYGLTILKLMTWEDVSKWLVVTSQLFRIQKFQMFVCFNFGRTKIDSISVRLILHVWKFLVQLVAFDFYSCFYINTSNHNSVYLVLQWRELISSELIVFGSTLKKINFLWIDSVKLILTAEPNTI